MGNVINFEEWRDDIERKRSTERLQCAHAHTGRWRANVKEHSWVPSKLGHGKLMCKKCMITWMEMHAIGQFHCDGE